MSSTAILSLLEQLDDEVDDLEDAIEPVLQQSLADLSPNLPLLDRAKLYVLVTYAVESLLFSFLRIQGVKAREHPVFAELTRVKAYFEKIKSAETPVASRTHVLDTHAATRFIKAGLHHGNARDQPTSSSIERMHDMARAAPQESKPKTSVVPKDQSSRVVNSTGATATAMQNVDDDQHEASETAMDAQAVEADASASADTADEIASSRRKAEKRQRKEASKARKKSRGSNP